MAQGRLIVDADIPTADSSGDATTQVDAGFGAEFRELARQRRFVRSAEPAPAPGADWRDGAAADGGWRDDAAPPRRTRPAARSTAPAAAPAPESTPQAAAPAAPVTRTAAPLPAASSLRRAAVDPRLSDDQRATLRELARMSDRLVDSREQLVEATSRAQQLAAELDVAKELLRAEEQRVIASRMLVQDAQRTTRDLAERCAWLEARCETLQEALELAVNASWTTRWRWRRERRARTRTEA